MKLVRAVLASVCALAAAGPARAETWSKQLTPGKTADNLYSFTIKAERQKDNQTGEYLAFHVAVKPNAAAGKGLRSGTLEVYDGKEFVSSCEVRPAEKGRDLSYSFRIAAKYAGKSRFTFAELLGEFDAAYYWFHPADFIDPTPKPAAPKPAAMPRIEILGFGSMMEPKFFRDYWDSLPDDARLTGKLADHLTPDRIASVVALEVNAGVAGFFDPVRTSLDDEFKLFLTSGGLPAPHRFHTGRLPAGFEKDRPPKVYVLLVRTKKGEYGLITFYSGFVVIEMNKQIGVVLLEDGGKTEEKKDKQEKGKEPPAAAADPITAGMRAALARANAVHTGMDRKTIDDAVAQLHREIAKHDPKVFVPLAVRDLIRLAPHDTATRVLLRKALAQGWLDEFTARMYLIQAGDPPGPHIAAMLKAVGGRDRKARRAALTALRGVGVAGADALPALRKFVIDAKAPQTDFERAYNLQNPAPDHILAWWADNAIEAAIKDAAAKPKPEPPVDLSRFPTLRGKVKAVLGHLNTYIPPKEGEPFELPLKDLPKLTSLKCDPGEKSYTALYGSAVVESVRYYTNGAFASMRLVSKSDPKVWRGAVIIDIIAGGGKFQMWVVVQSDVTKGVVLIEGEYDGTFPDRPK